MGLLLCGPIRSLRFRPMIFWRSQERFYSSAYKITPHINTVKGRVQTIFVKNNVKMTFWGGQERDVSRLLTGHLLRACGRQVTLWGVGKT